MCLSFYRFCMYSIKSKLNNDYGFYSHKDRRTILRNQVNIKPSFVGRSSKTEVLIMQYKWSSPSWREGFQSHVAVIVLRTGRNSKLVYSTRYIYQSFRCLMASEPLNCWNFLHSRYFSSSKKRISLYSIINIINCLRSADAGTKGTSSHRVELVLQNIPTSSLEGFNCDAVQEFVNMIFTNN